MTKFSLSETFSAIICALLFGSTMILSAVGPERASSDVPPAGMSQYHSTAGHYRA